MSEDSEHREEALRNIHNGSLLARQGPIPLNQSFAVSREKRLQFPEISAMEIASIAAHLYPQISDPKDACEHAAKLVRQAQIQIEQQKEQDNRTGYYLEANERNQRWPKLLGERIAKNAKGKMTCREKWNESQGLESSNSHLHPFPISRSELIALLVEGGMSKSTANDHLNKRTEERVHAKNPDLSENEVEARRKELLKPIFQPLFVELAETWPEFRKVIENFCIKD